MRCTSVLRKCRSLHNSSVRLALNSNASCHTLVAGSPADSRFSISTYTNSRRSVLASKFSLPTFLSTFFFTTKYKLASTRNLDRAQLAANKRSTALPGRIFFQHFARRFRGSSPGPIT
uniref:(northern house mosquito) hypothetical protein n=1 Tax=Culex pipiens TaxID=7175 RepID=A0A8D8AWM2_CULPI